MGSIIENSEGRSFEVGRVKLEVRGDSSFIEAIVRPTGEPYLVLLTLNPKDSKALFQVLEHVFGHWDERPHYPPPRELWAHSSFHYLAPLVDRPDIFWISSGPLNSYIPLAHMEAVYRDFQAALKLANLTPN